MAASARGPRPSQADLVPGLLARRKLLASASDGEPTLFVWETLGQPSRPAIPGLRHEGSPAGVLARWEDAAGRGDRGASRPSNDARHRPPSEYAGPVQGKERVTLQRPCRNVRSLTFSKAAGGGHRSEDGVVKVWDLSDQSRDVTWAEPSR